MLRERRGGGPFCTFSCPPACSSIFRCAPLPALLFPLSRRALCVPCIACALHSQGCTSCNDTQFGGPEGVQRTVLALFHSPPTPLHCTADGEGMLPACSISCWVCAELCGSHAAPHAPHSATAGRMPFAGGASARICTGARLHTSLRKLQRQAAAMRLSAAALALALCLGERGARPQRPASSAGAPRKRAGRSERGARGGPRGAVAGAGTAWCSPRRPLHPVCVLQGLRNRRDLVLAAPRSPPDLTRRCRPARRRGAQPRGPGAAAHFRPAAAGGQPEIHSLRGAAGGQQHEDLDGDEGARLGAAGSAVAAACSLHRLRALLQLPAAAVV